jgi:glycogen debranching enzyme
MSEFTDQAYRRAVDLLEKAATPHGFVASPAFDHYAVVWARDALISSLGALALGTPKLVRAVASTLDTLSSHASPLGQIPALVAPARNEWDFAEGGVVDTTALFVVVVDSYAKATGDVERVRTWWPAVDAAMRWLRYQDVTGSGLISAAPSTDWMDAALTRSGRTLHLNVLYFWAATAYESVAALTSQEAGQESSRIGRAIDDWFWPSPRVDAGTLFPHGFAHDATRIAYWEAASENRTHYLSHIVHAAFIDRCDVLANVLAIRSGLADGEKSRRILEVIADCADPYPTRTFPEPIAHGDGTGMLISVAEAAIPDRWRNRPGTYHNAAAWPFVGGFHVEALARVSGSTAALPLLERLAAANAAGEWSFAEWIDAAGAPAGAALQTWNAATFVLAYRACLGS